MIDPWRPENRYRSSCSVGDDKSGGRKILGKEPMLKPIKKQHPPLKTVYDI